jgi:hypothetical protein
MSRTCFHHMIISTFYLMDGDRYKFALQRMSIREAQRPEAPGVRSSPTNSSSNTSRKRRQLGVAKKVPTELNTDPLVAAKYLFDSSHPKGSVRALLEHLNVTSAATEVNVLPSESKDSLSELSLSPSSSSSMSPIADNGTTIDWETAQIKVRPFDLLTMS